MEAACFKLPLFVWYIFGLNIAVSNHLFDLNSVRIYFSRIFDVKMRDSIVV